jgi:hypothetical protein
MSDEHRDRVEESERLRFGIIEKAVKAAETIILKETDGSLETLLWLTLEMANVYQDKASVMVTQALYRKLMFEENGNIKR